MQKQHFFPTKYFWKNNKPENFLIMLGSINTIVMIVSFIALYVIDKARNGSVVVISKILGEFNMSYLILFLLTGLFRYSWN